MAKRTSTTYLTPGEQVAGAVLFVIYLLVLPFATGPLFRLAEALLGTQLSPALENILYYYILFAVTVIVFHGFLGRTTRVLLDGRAARERCCWRGWWRSTDSMSWSTG